MGPIVTITHKEHPNDPVQVKLAEVGKTAEANRQILPGDTVMVSRTGIVYVVGDVKNPSGVVIANDSEMTVLKAIAIAGGVNPTAAINRAKLIRRTSNGPEERAYRAKKDFRGENFRPETTGRRHHLCPEQRGQGCGQTSPRSGSPGSHWRGDLPHAVTVI